MIIIAIFTVNIPHVSPIPCNKLIGNILQRRRVIYHPLITHLLGLILVRDIFQLPWACLNRLLTHFLCFKMIRDMPQNVWVVAHSLVTLFLRLEMIRDLSYPAWNIFIRHSYSYPGAQARIKFHEQECRSTFQLTLISVNSFDVKNDGKWWWDYWSYTLNHATYRCINNEYTPKKGDFFKKKMIKPYSKAIILSLKIYENTKIQLSNVSP